jgi:hypothetical protein
LKTGKTYHIGLRPRSGRRRDPSAGKYFKANLPSRFRSGPPQPWQSNSRSFLGGDATRTNLYFASQFGHWKVAASGIRQVYRNKKRFSNLATEAQAELVSTMNTNAARVSIKQQVFRFTRACAVGDSTRRKADFTLLNRPASYPRYQRDSPMAWF